MKIVIIGGVALGATVASKLQRNNKNYVVEVFEKSSKVSYSNCGLPYGLSNAEKVENLAPKKDPKISKMGVIVHVNHQVLSINETMKTIEVKDITKNNIIKVKYDKLVLAMGAKPIYLPIKNLKKEKNVFIFKTYDDLVILDKMLKKGNKVIIAGAGFTGVEVAENIKERGNEVTIVEPSYKISGLDFDISSLIEDYLDKKGIKIISGVSLNEVNIKSKHAILSNGQKLDYDSIITTGILPNIDLVKDTNIKLEQGKFIKVDKYNRTSNKNIYAGGDLVLSTNLVDNKKIYSPMARNANYHARIIADHISRLKPNKPLKSSLAFIVKLFDKSAGGVGLTEFYLKKTNIKYEVDMSTVPSSSIYSHNYDKIVMKIIYASSSKKILGFQAFGKSVDKLIDSFSILIKNKATMYELEPLYLSYQPWFSTVQNPINILGQIFNKKQSIGYKTICPYAIPKDSFIIDIRDKAKYKKSHVWNAVNIKKEDFNNKNLPKDKIKPIYVYCNTGFSSVSAAIKLRDIGYKNVFNIYGGNTLQQAMYKKVKKGS